MEGPLLLPSPKREQPRNTDHGSAVDIGGTSRKAGDPECRAKARNGGLQSGVVGPAVPARGELIHHPGFERVGVVDLLRKGAERIDAEKVWMALVRVIGELSQRKRADQRSLGEASMSSLKTT